MKKTTLVATTVLAATILGTGISASAAEIQGLDNQPVLPLEVKASHATFAFSDTTSETLETINFEEIAFDTPSLIGEVTVGATLGNKDFGTKAVDVAVTTNGVGLSIEKGAGLKLEAKQATRDEKEDTFEYTLNAMKFDSKAAESYNVTITATDTTNVDPELPEGQL